MVIIGAGGMGREALFLLQNINTKSKQYTILGFIDNDIDLQGKTVNGFPILGNDSWLDNYQDEINVVAAIGSPFARKKTIEKFDKNSNITFPNIIANDVTYSDCVYMGRGNIIGFSSVLMVNITIGNFVIVNPSCIIQHDVSIGDFVSLYGSVHIAGNVSIGECAEIGVGAKVIQGKSIGDNAIIGAGAVVVRDIPANCTAVGVPAKSIKISYSVTTTPHPPTITYNNHQKTYTQYYTVNQKTPYWSRHKRCA
jgi:sugar O-acyltransferase (sialic acid O-acetyltransferase NeuD family)